MSIPKAAFPFTAEARAPFAGSARRLAAAGLTAASAVLSRLAAQLSEPGAAAATSLPQLEFHAEAGAPEGALYLDGMLIGHLSGVRRL